jgi:hypothetical protein
VETKELAVETQQLRQTGFQLNGKGEKEKKGRDGFDLGGGEDETRLAVLLNIAQGFGFGEPRQGEIKVAAREAIITFGERTEQKGSEREMPAERRSAGGRKKLASQG